MVILGMDGMDPALMRRMIAEGQLPHFKSLAEQGSFSPLQTSNPPQSPVAWSCFISGHNPGEHDVFDFVVRNPETHFPEIGMTEEDKSSSPFKKLMSGLTGPSLKTRRKGKTFWDYLGAQEIKSVILRCPVTFPAESMAGRLLSGMGTPDIRGTQGISAFYSSQPLNDKEAHGKWIQVSWKEGKIETVASGPRIQGGAELSVPVTLFRVDSKKIKATVGGQNFELSVGQWSPWVRLEFKSGVMNKLYGICRFHLNSVEPEFGLYMTPVNLDPQSPALQISYPTTYAKEIFEKIGNFYTQGMPYDTWALNEGRLSDEKFLEQAYSILDENIKTLDLELSRYESGLLFSYFGITDLIQHMFWRYQDPGHPAQETSTQPAVKNAIRDVYKAMDKVLGEVLKKIPSDTALIVLSDHGFGSFRRSVHVNSWLRDNGFLTLKEGAREGAEFFANVDWENTRAYSVGFGGIYINQFGREKKGVVYKGAETDALKKEIVDLISKWKDKDGTLVVKKVYRGEEMYKGPYAGNGPDLYMGFNLPFRASWQTGLGASPSSLIEDNIKSWSGDHLCDPSLVPGVLFSNKKLKGEHPSLIDLGPTVLDYFDVEGDPRQEGHSLLVR